MPQGTPRAGIFLDDAARLYAFSTASALQSGRGCKFKARRWRHGSGDERSCITSSGRAERRGPKQQPEEQQKKAVCM